MLKKFLIITCASFTAVMLFFALFATVNTAIVRDIDRVLTIQVLLMNASIALLMVIVETITNRFEKVPLGVDAIIRVLICYLVIFFEGYWFGWFELSLNSLVLITPVLVVAFLITYLVMYMTCADYADVINKNIKKKRRD